LFFGFIFLMQLTLKQIRYFLAAAETGQFSAAALQVHVTQTAITASIKELEQSLNVALFERRHASGVELTPDGHRFMQHALNIQAAVNNAVTNPGTLQRNISGKVHLQSTSTMYGYYLIPAIARFKAAFPDIGLSVEEQDRSAIEDNVVKGAADVGIIWLNGLQNSRDLDAVALTRSRRQLWLCASHPLLKRRYVSLQDVARESYVVFDSDEVKKNTLKFWQDAGLKPDIAYTTSSMEAVRSLVAQGMAVTILSDVAYRPFSREGLRIDTRPLLEGLPPIEIGIIWKRDHDLTPAAAAFKSFMELTFNGPGAGVKIV
jgi:DNA-binding transcriptional LysR family regulator